MFEFVTGAEVITRAAIDAGCNFFAGYPITPATGILINMMRRLPAAGGLAIQGEDEIASIGFCLGAAAAGKKAMTATSGPGLSLYSENIGFAQMAELPLVIVNVQRMGPATGGATTNAEGDIQFCRWVTSGGYPVIALCPTTVEEAYTLSIDAFNMAERFRTPVFLITSKDLVMTRQTADISLYRRPPAFERALAKDAVGFEPYGYASAGDVPPFAPIGGDILTRMTTSIHGPDGHITKDARVMARALEHLKAKIESKAETIERVDADIDEGADAVIVAYGMMGRVSRAVCARVRGQGKKISLICVHSLWPVPERALARHIGAHRRIIVPELNPGQYCLEIERLFPEAEVIRINRIDGKLIAPQTIIEEGKLL